MSSICGNCAWRSNTNVNQWFEAPKNICLNIDSFKYRRAVTKGMTCSKFEKENVPEGIHRKAMPLAGLE